MDTQEGQLIPNEPNAKPDSTSLLNNPQSQPHQQEVLKVIPKVSAPSQKVVKKQKVQQPEKDDSPKDIIKELVQNNNPLPLIAVRDQIDLYTKTSDGVPLFNLLMNKFLPVQDLLQKLSIKFSTDEDGRTPLHYAVEADDTKAVNWLLKKGAHNVADKFGNTPIMDAVRFGNRRSFLLCMHYQHLSQELPHVAAQYNRVWQLKCMLSKGLNLQVKDNKSQTPLQIAVINYSYDAAQYLASVTTNYQISQLKQLTDSKGIIKKVQNGKSKSSKIDRQLKPVLYRFIPIIVSIIIVNAQEYFVDVKSNIYTDFLILLVLYLIALILSKVTQKKSKSPENLLHLLYQPQFPNNTDHICPGCLNRYHHEKEDHCYVCHTCVPRFQLHEQFCINKYNQIIWFVYQFWLLRIFWGLANRVVDFHRITYVNQQGQQQGYIWTYLTIFHDQIYKQGDTLATLSLIFLIGVTLQQTTKCLLLIGMAFMNRTYQQVVRSQDYPHLYTIFRNKEGKLKTKQDRIFHKYKLLGGLCVGIKNILTYFL